ncbi:ImmA/IrrE family metallo-endopeptidase [Lacticaseibacillus salsurivasis]|uniref:ImmA/IrrE family metallo-endopeptidase n=1 Tax=Lacticaseibacillus salsurivasis TaxID=3081441 RepID=UPI0030C6D352
MIDDLLDTIRNIAWDLGIGWEVAQLHPEQSPLVDTGRRLIILNSNWPNKREMPFQAAHELAHVINGDVGTYYYTRERTDSRIEGSANRQALKILVPLYFQSIDRENANVQQFMVDLSIPSWLEPKAEETIGAFYCRLCKTSGGDVDD